MRRIAAAGAVVGALLVFGGAAGPASADAPVVGGCDPVPRTPANCSKWNTTPVKLVWSLGVDYAEAPLTGSDCTREQNFTADTAGTDVMCAVWLATAPHGPVTNPTVTIRLDRTPPTVTGFTPARPPDHDGWWNHPVSVQFNATDATSGVGGCDAVDYSGPDGATAQVTGGCRDVAGNAATGTFPIKYDSTPPTVLGLPSQTDVGRNTLNWATSTDAVATQVLRSPGVGGAAVSEVYSGSGSTFADSSVTGGKTYAYTLNASDAAGNVASTTVNITAKPRPQASSAAVKGGPPRLSWHRVKGADYYNVQLFRKGTKVLSSWPHLNGLKLHTKWTFRGRPRVLAAGTYEWYVWPGFGKRSQHHYGKLIAHRKFKLAPAANSARAG